MHSSHILSIPRESPQVFTLNRWRFYGVPWGVMIACVLLSIGFPAPAQQHGAAFLLISAVLFGMPHGACDLIALRNVRGHGMTAKALAQLVTAYVAVALLTLAVWRLNSALALLGFLLITVWHFGNGDAWIQSTGRLSRIVYSLGRGLLVMGAPLAFQPHATQEILNGFIVLSSRDGSLNWLWQIAPYLVVLALALQAAGQGIQVLWEQASPSAQRASEWNYQALYFWMETVLLLLLFAFAPPLLAIACYFMGVHAWRHLLRLEAHRIEERPKVLSMRDVLMHYHGQSIGLTLVTYLGLIPIFFFWPALLKNVGQWSVAYLVLVSAVTTPHAILIGYLEWQRRL